MAYAKTEDSTSNPKACKKHFAKNASAILAHAQSLYPMQPFKMMTDAGEVIILPAQLANEIRHEADLHFIQTVDEDFHASITEPFSAEANFATQLRFGNSTEWQEFSLIPEILDVVVRLSSRVFLGDQLCRDEAWLEITKTYTMSVFNVANELRLRRAARQEALAAGTPVPTFNDALDWVEDESQGRPYDADVFQPILSTAAIHTTTDLLSEALLQLVGRPELMAQLRQEVVEVLTASGWKKTALFNLNLMGSVIKEAQRLKPTAIASMARMATQDVKLPNSETLRKGQRCLVDSSQMRDHDIYETPDEFDGYHFEPHLVSTRPAHLGFGHRQHAFPGRFFAANEIEVALCHLFTKYDWKLAPGCTPMPLAYGFSLGMDQSAQVMVRRRTPEIDIDAI
ncbi:ent-kaurene oxidase [Ilyonectria destructans]|nr:ent-kaurene oxidase [Ilyonectria destructans]